MSFLEVKFDCDENLGTVNINDKPIFCAVCKSVKDLKLSFINYFSEKFDESVSNDLVIGFPYIIGNMTFYTISEIEKYIEGTQNKKKE